MESKAIVHKKASRVYIEHKDGSFYPSCGYSYALSQKYPEYRWNDV